MTAIIANVAVTWTCAEAVYAVSSDVSHHISCYFVVNYHEGCSVSHISLAPHVSCVQLDCPCYGRQQAIVTEFIKLTLAMNGPEVVAILVHFVSD